MAGLDLTLLDEFCCPTRRRTMDIGLSELDGFLPGLIVGPELILPSE